MGIRHGQGGMCMIALPQLWSNLVGLLLSLFCMKYGHRGHGYGHD